MRAQNFSSPKKQDLLAHSELATELTVIKLTKHFARDIFLEEGIISIVFVYAHVCLSLGNVHALGGGKRTSHPGAAVAVGHE